MARIKFTQRDGTPVSFTTHPGKRKKSHRPNVYARFVKKNIDKYLRKGKSAKQAMKLVAKEWDNQSAAPRRGARNGARGRSAPGLDTGVMRTFSRLENTRGTHNKFWEGKVNGSTLKARWGRIGSTGQSKNWSFPTPREAKVELNQKVESKIAKGYDEVDIKATRELPLSYPKSGGDPILDKLLKRHR